MKTLLIIRGVSGSGKSTLANRLRKEEAAFLHADHFEADQFFVDRHGNYTFDRTELKNAHQWCQSQTAKSLREGKTVIVSNTFTTEREYLPYVQLAKQYEATLVFSHCNGHFESIHDVPNHVIEMQRERFEPLPEHYSELIFE
ncbi:ATP-binding protein [Vibrio sp. PNB22_3_1]